MKIKILKELIKENILNINNQTEFETVINFNDKVSNFIQNIKDRETKKSLLHILILANNKTNYYEDLKESICDIKNEKILKTSLPLINYLVECYYINSLSSKKVLFTINSLSIIKSTKTVEALKTMINNQEFLNKDLEDYEDAIKLIVENENPSLTDIYLNFILDKYLLNSPLYNYILNELKKIDNPNILEVLLSLITDEDLQNSKKNFKFAFDIAKDIKNVDILFPLCEMLTFDETLNLLNYKEFINKIISSKIFDKPIYLNALNDIIQNIDGDRDYDYSNYISLINILPKVDPQNIWEFIKLASDKDLYTSDYYHVALLNFTKIKTNFKSIIEYYVDLATNEEYLNLDEYIEITEIACQIKDYKIFDYFFRVLENENLKETDYLLFALKTISTVNISIVNSIESILCDLFLIKFSNYTVLINKILKIKDPYKIELIKDYLVWNTTIDDEKELTTIINNALNIENTEILENYFTYIKNSSEIINRKNLIKAACIMSTVTNPNIFDNIENLLNTTYNLEETQVSQKSGIIQGISKFLNTNNNLEPQKSDIITSLPLNKFGNKTLKNLLKVILNKDLYNSPHFSHIINLFRNFNEENCEILTKLLSNEYLLKREDYKTITTKITNIKEISHLNILLKLIEALNMINKLEFDFYNYFSKIVSLENERITRNLTHLLQDLNNLPNTNINYSEIIDEYLNNPTNEKIKALTKIAISSNDVVRKHSHMLYKIILYNFSEYQTSLYTLNIAENELHILEEELFDISASYPTEEITTFALTATSAELLEELEFLDENMEVKTLRLNKLN